MFNFDKSRMDWDYQRGGLKLPLFKWRHFENLALHVPGKGVKWSTNVREKKKKEREKSKPELFARRLIPRYGSLWAVVATRREELPISSPWRPAAMGQGEKPWNVTGRILWLSYLWHASALSKKNAAPGINNRRWWNSFCRGSRGTLWFISCVLLAD